MLCSRSDLTCAHAFVVLTLGLFLSTDRSEHVGVLVISDTGYVTEATCRTRSSFRQIYGAIGAEKTARYRFSHCPTLPLAPSCFADTPDTGLQIPEHITLKVLSGTRVSVEAFTSLSPDCRSSRHKCCRVSST